MLDRNRLASHLQAFPQQTIPLGSLRPAAVLIPLYQRDDCDYLLFTERTAHLEHHGGEISFPGGGHDAGDTDLSATAKRETEEELGIARTHIRRAGTSGRFLFDIWLSCCSLCRHHPQPRQPASRSV